jgi:flagellar protein FlbD
VINLHRLGHKAEAFSLNPDLILTVEATPDTVVTLTTGTKIVVVESPERVAAEVREWRTGILRAALSREGDEALAPRSSGSPSVSALLTQRRTLSAVDRSGVDPTEHSPPPADHLDR